jgi:hypothetical protein
VVQKSIINLAVYKGLFPNFFSSYDWVENVSLGVRIGENRTRRAGRVRTSPWDLHFHIPCTFAVANVVPKTRSNQNYTPEETKSRLNSGMPATNPPRTFCNPVCCLQL